LDWFETGQRVRVAPPRLRQQRREFGFAAHDPVDPWRDIVAAHRCRREDRAHRLCLGCPVGFEQEAPETDPPVGAHAPATTEAPVEPGDQIEVALNDGTTRAYEVTERTMYGKLALPKERIWRNTGAEELVLITCGGEFNPEIRSFKSNIVVYAVPIG
jgi:hypothetical protein